MPVFETSLPQDVLRNYQLRLPGYEGPFDVLLRLIERQQLEIADVSLVAVTAQFLAYIDTLTQAPNEIVASFTAVGTRLTVLKSRSLLPRPPRDEDDDEPSNLTHQLLEYRRARDTSQYLAARFSMDLRSYARAGTPGIDAETWRSADRLAPHHPQSLVELIRRRLTQAPRPDHIVPRRKPITLRETIGHILDTVRFGPMTRFSDIVAGYHTRAEIATAFLGLLVLVRRSAVSVGQERLFGDIRIERGPDARTQGDVSNDDR